MPDFDGIPQHVPMRGRKCKRSLRGSGLGVPVLSAAGACCCLGCSGGRRKERGCSRRGMPREGIGSAARSHGGRFVWQRETNAAVDAGGRKGEGGVLQGGRSALVVRQSKGRYAAAGM
ncbi:hypothetical protein BT67DRAFT_63765 [Trichocladium antarcticum]|uniref:Uncharacterized protein n=1 Tax=Trichocladium antarcticum TaxID=1450529 RepID=A0AAN6ZC66_9PEZI|nr:hypothetical protein BT67DRAFT_63765 [Trichocladium antarcticum]